MNFFHWQMTDQEKRKVCRPLEKLQRDYAIKVRKLVEKLPRKLHKTAFYEACDPAYRVCIELSKMDIDKFGIKSDDNDPYQNVDMTPDAEGRSTGDVNDR